MSSQKIEKILERYFHGETSLAEEQRLRNFFLKEELPSHLEELREQFLFYEQEKDHKLPETFDEELFDAIDKQERSKRASRRAVFYYVSSVAAAILIIITVFISFDPKTGNSREAEEAFAQASQVLYFVSDKFIKGSNPLERVKRFNDGVENLKKVKKFEEGVDKTAPVSKFNQITNLITNPAPTKGAQ